MSGGRYLEKLITTVHTIRQAHVEYVAEGLTHRQIASWLERFNKGGMSDVDGHNTAIEHVSAK